VQLAQEHGVTQGRKLRVDTTVVETNIHYPTEALVNKDVFEGIMRQSRSGIGTWH